MVSRCFAALAELKRELSEMQRGGAVFSRRAAAAGENPSRTLLGLHSVTGLHSFTQASAIKFSGPEPSQRQESGFYIRRQERGRPCGADPTQSFGGDALSSQGPHRASLLPTAELTDDGACICGPCSGAHDTRGHP